MLQAWFEEGLRHQLAGRWPEAEAAYRRILAQWPDTPEVHFNLGTVFKAQHRLDDATACFRTALLLRPDFPEALNNLGNTLCNQAQPDAALDLYRRAIALRPDFADAWNNLGLALKDTAQLDEALACFARAMSIQPDHPGAEGNRLVTLYFHPGYDAAAIHQAARAWSERVARPLLPLARPHDNDREPHRRLRIGYVAPDFRRHCQSLFTPTLLANHDRRAVEVFCYSNNIAADGVTARLRSLADQWREIARLDDDAAADLIRRDRIDILVDLTLHMASNRLRLFARRPAPVQVTWLGYPGTTGLDALDYRLTDPRLDPPTTDSATIYSEESVRLPETFWCYDPYGMEDSPTPPLPEPGPLPALSAGHVTFGCLNNFCKVTAPTLSLWAQVLAAIPRSRLILLAPPGLHRQRVLDQLGLAGESRNRVEFIEFQPRRQYLQTYRRIDLGLDTFPYNGHTTSLDSLWMGVPILTLAGPTAVGRAGLSQSYNLGLTDFVAATGEEFVANATRWAGNPDRLAELRASLRQRMTASPLMDGRRFARHVEAAYRTMWERWCAKHV